jgi:hypothetical protein
MGVEPNARLRLRLVSQFAADPVLRHELATALGEDSMPFVPSADLAREIASCSVCRSEGGASLSRSGLCETHRTRWNLESCMADVVRDVSSVQLERLMRRALASDEAGRQFLSAFERQSRALKIVWEAHQRGAALLPEPVAAAVEQARADVPLFLLGAGPQTVSRAS